MQWNFYVAQHWSVFGEPGLRHLPRLFRRLPELRRGVLSRPSGFAETGIEPALFLGGRYHFNDAMSLTMRIGFPTLASGVSFFPVSVAPPAPLEA